MFQDFLQEEEGRKVVMVTDPPFGGLVKPLAHSFRQISDTWRELQGTGEGSCTSNAQIYTFLLMELIVGSCSVPSILGYWIIVINSSAYDCTDHERMYIKV